LAALYLAAASFPAADWADHLALVPLAAIASALLGLLLAHSRFRGRTASFLAAAYGVNLLGWLLARTLDPALSWLERGADLAGRMGVFLLTIARGEASRDPLMFVLFMAGFFWFLGAYGSWVLFRRHGYWGAILLPGLALVLNTHYYRSGTGAQLYLPAFLLLALALALRTELISRRATWTQFRAQVPPDASFHIARAGLAAGAVLIAVAWLLPGFAAYGRMADAWSEPTGPLQSMRDFFSDALGGLRYPVSVVSESFGDFLELGAGVEPSEKAVFVARSESAIPETVRLYWRARVLDVYDAGRWTSTAVEPESFDPRQGALPLPAYDGRIERDFALTVLVPALHLLYLPAQPAWVNREAEVRTTAAGDDGLDVLDVTARTFVLEGETYRVIGSLAAPRAGSLRADANLYPEWVRKRYLQLPDSLPPSIGELARTIVADAPTAFDQAVAITAWLRTNIVYQRVTSQPPLDRDPVEWFLSDSRVGFCDYYASAEVLMLRTLGVPARLATGYAQGEFDAETDSYFVSELDAHAWPEVFFPSYGWVEFEPTTSQEPLLRLEENPGAQPGQPEPSTGDSNTAGGGAQDSAGLPVGAGSGLEDGPSAQDGALAAGGAWPWIVALAVGLAGALFLIRYRSLGMLESEVGGAVGRLHSLRWWAATPARRTYGSMVRWGRWLGISLGPAGTPLEQAEALARLLPESGAAARTIAEAYASERYGSHAVDPGVVRQAWLGLRWQLARASLRSALRPFARRVASDSRSKRGPQHRPPS
jgi:transglutaminase-like putative cysteine protease